MTQEMMPWRTFQWTETSGKGSASRDRWEREVTVGKVMTRPGCVFWFTHYSKVQQN